jgi:hypothetical protein
LWLSENLSQDLHHEYHEEIEKDEKKLREIKSSSVFHRATSSHIRVHVEDLELYSCDLPDLRVNSATIAVPNSQKNNSPFVYGTMRSGFGASVGSGASQIKRRRLIEPTVLFFDHKSFVCYCSASSEAVHGECSHLSLDKVSCRFWQKDIFLIIETIQK